MVKSDLRRLAALAAAALVVAAIVHWAGAPLRACAAGTALPWLSCATSPASGSG
jgi:hypothetical protein